MDHDAVLEALELATAEPDGLDRLMAGDTPAAQAVAGHLAGCPDCTLELVRLRRVGALVRDAVVSTPSPDLRDRTLAYVRQHGRPRGPALASDAVPVAIPARRRGGIGPGLSRDRPGAPGLHVGCLARRGRRPVRGRDHGDRRLAPGRPSGRAGRCHRRPRGRHHGHPAGDRRARRHPGRSRESDRGGGQRHPRVLAIDHRPGRRRRRADRACMPAWSTAAGSRSTGSVRGSARCSSAAVSPTGSGRRPPWPDWTATWRSACPSSRPRAGSSLPIRS